MKIQCRPTAAQRNVTQAQSCLVKSAVVDRLHFDDAAVIAAALYAARARLIAAAADCQQRNKTIRAVYYGGGRGEEVVGDIVCRGASNNIVTRNHYGSLVLNAAHALFIDVDVSSPSQVAAEVRGGRVGEAWPGVLDDLRTVLAAETDESFRIYRTAAGFRILATEREYDPASPLAAEMMQSAGADCDFVSLCRIQNSFRARLSPKPWRCGVRRPPNLFPRHTAGEHRRFADWLSRYAAACSDRATCRYLCHVGRDYIHPHISPIVELHDRETKAHVPLALA